MYELFYNIRERDKKRKDNATKRNSEEACCGISPTP
jgi:hypothetical protein